MKIEAKQRLQAQDDDRAKWDSEVLKYIQQHGNLNQPKAYRRFMQEQAIADNFYKRKQGPEQTALFILGD